MVLDQQYRPLTTGRRVVAMELGIKVDTVWPEYCPRDRIHGDLGEDTVVFDLL